MKLFASLLLFVFLSPAAQAEGLLCQDLLDNIPQSLQSQVMDYEFALDREEAQTDGVRNKIKQNKFSINNIEKRIGWRERITWVWLAKLLGGDKRDINNYKTYREKREELAVLLDKDLKGDSEADQEVLKVIDNYFIARDKHYAELRQTEIQLNDLVCEGTKCLSRINTAIDSVDNAQHWQSMNRNSKNSSDYMARSAMNTAKDDHNSAKNTAENYMNAVRQYQGQAAIDTATSFSDDFLDAMVDLSILFPNNGSLGLDIFRSLNLSNMEDELDLIETKVRRIQNALKSEHKSLKNKLDAVLCEARRLCNINELDKKLSGTMINR